METTNAWVDEPTNEELRAISRRSALKLLGGAGLFIVAACVSDSVATATTVAGTNPGTAAGGAATTTAAFGAAGSCVLIPEETEGPYALDLSGEEPMFRSEITEGHPGVPLSLTMTLVDTNADCAPVSGARVDLWHCDAVGVYSGFSQPGTDTVGETFCRGIQLTEGNGQVTFQTVYPGWYQGRITHVHFQVFLGSGLAATSQISFPEEVTDAVYAVEPYAAKGPNTSVASFSQDMVFADGTQYQMASLSGDTGSGYTASLLVGVAA
jgi:protocatechuate 3,4-dioxygenase beta subunit